MGRMHTMEPRHGVLQANSSRRAFAQSPMSASGTSPITSTSETAWYTWSQAQPTASRFDLERPSLALDARERSLMLLRGADAHETKPYDGSMTHPSTAHHACQEKTVSEVKVR
jgi:hypothetical protein